MHGVRSWGPGWPDLSGVLYATAPCPRAINHWNPDSPVVQWFPDSVFLDPIDECLAANIEVTFCIHPSLVFDFSIHRLCLSSGWKASIGTIYLHDATFIGSRRTGILSRRMEPALRMFCRAVWRACLRMPVEHRRLIDSGHFTRWH